MVRILRAVWRGEAAKCRSRRLALQAVAERLPAKNPANRDDADGRHAADRKIWKTQALYATVDQDSWRYAMSPLDVADNKATADQERASSLYVPPLQRTE